MGLKAQKKLLGKMSGKKMAKVFIDDTTGRILDNTHKIIKSFTSVKKDSEKTLKYLIKTVVKVGILYKNDQFDCNELKLVESFKQKFHSLAMTVVSFHEVEFTYDKNYLIKSLEECQAILQSLVARHLTDKSKMRIDNVFDFFSNIQLLDALFQADSNYKDTMNLIVKDLNKMMDEGTL